MSNPYRKFTKYQRHVNNAQEVISADHINTIQKSVNVAENNVIDLHANEFLNKTIFVFNNNIYVNQMFVDLFENQQFINMSKSRNSFFDSKERILFVNGDVSETSIYTESLYTKSDVLPNDFVVMIDCYIPPGANIDVFISTNNKDYYPIRYNDITKPNRIKFKNNTSNDFELTLKFKVKKNYQNESPKISGFSVMWFDASVEREYGLTNPDLGQFETEPQGDVVLVRDRLLDDKLVKVIEKDIITNLYYKETGELDRVETVSLQKTSIETLIYGDYLNSNNIIETKLLRITREILDPSEMIEPDEIFEEGETL